MRNKNSHGNIFPVAVAMFLLAGCGATPNPRANATTEPVEEDTVTRRYNVGDLLYLMPAPSPEEVPDLCVPTKPSTQLFNHADGQNQQPHSGEPQIYALRDYIEENIDPPSWKSNGGIRGSISSSPHRAAFLITHTPATHHKIEILLDNLRKSLERQTTLEFRVVTYECDEERLLPEQLQARLAEVRNAGRYRRDVLLDGEELDQLNKSLAAQMHGISMGHGPPRLTLFDGQRSALVVQTQQAYVADLKETADGDKSNKPGWHYEPVIQATTATGVVFNVVSCQSPDGKTVFVDLHGSCARLLELITERFGNGHDGVAGTIQRPVLSVFKIDAACAIPDDGALLLGGTTEIKSGDPAFNATSPDRPATDAKIKELTEKDSHRHVYLLVRPKILVQKETPPSTAKVGE